MKNKVFSPTHASDPNEETDRPKPSFVSTAEIVTFRSDSIPNVLRKVADYVEKSELSAPDDIGPIAVWFSDDEDYCGATIIGEARIGKRLEDIERLSPRKKKTSAIKRKQ